MLRQHSVSVHHATHWSLLFMFSPTSSWLIDIRAKYVSTDRADPPSVSQRLHKSKIWHLKVDGISTLSFVPCYIQLVPGACSSSPTKTRRSTAARESQLKIHLLAQYYLQSRRSESSETACSTISIWRIFSHTLGFVLFVPNVPRDAALLGGGGMSRMFLFLLVVYSV